MVRLSHTLGACAILAACSVLALCVDQWRQVDPELERLRDRPGVVEAFRARQASRTPDGGEPASSPLVAQAEAFALYLSPPVVEAVAESGSVEVPLTSHGLQASAPTVRPVTASVSFRVIAVSCCQDRPERSMVLMCAVGSPESEARWIKEGAGIGHFVVHEIKQGAVVLRNGELQCELAVERGRLRRSLVRDVQAGTRQVSAAIDNAVATPASPAGANSTE